MEKIVMEIAKNLDMTIVASGPIDLISNGMKFIV